MARSIAALALAAVVVSGVGCAGVGAPLHGSFYQDVKYPVAVTTNEGGSKVGTATAVSYLGFVATGDASIEAAAAAGGIKKVKSVDAHARSIFGIIGWYTITVRGE